MEKKCTPYFPIYGEPPVIIGKQNYAVAYKETQKDTVLTKFRANRFCRFRTNRELMQQTKIESILIIHKTLKRWKMPLFLHYMHYLLTSSLWVALDISSTATYNRVLPSIRCDNTSKLPFNIFASHHYSGIYCKFYYPISSLFTFFLSLQPWTVNSNLANKIMATTLCATNYFAH